MTKKQKNELDRLLREACFMRDKNRCRKCGMTATLAPAHIFSKGHYRKQRWNLLNVITLCYRHHIHWAHREPLEFSEWIKKELGEDFEKLKLQSQYIDRSPMDYNTIKILLEFEIKQYAKN